MKTRHSLLAVAAAAALLPLAAMTAPNTLQQGWSDADRAFYYGTPQGTAMYPAAIMQALEAADGKPFMSRENLEQYGVLYPEKNLKVPNNPWDWPIGFVVDKLPTLGGPKFSVTCAACHTGEVRHKGKRLLIDGGQSVMDIGRMGNDWMRNFLATDADPARRERLFKRAVELGHPTEQMASDWAKVMTRTRNEATRGSHLASTAPGPGRLDAVASIATAVFVDGLGNPRNLYPADAPQSYPPLWDIWYFDWVQSNASASQPMLRNLTEAMGTGPNHFIHPDGTLKPEPDRWRSTYRIQNLYEIEERLQSLAPPPWPQDVLGPIDTQRAQVGRKLFDKHCASCHGIKQVEGASSPTWHLPMVPLARIGTDPMMVLAMSGRQYDASVLGINRPLNAIEGLNIVASKIKAQAYADAGITAEQAPRYDGFGRKPDLNRDACGYRPRTLMGIWATPPFLHNGSVPTVDDLLSETRPTRFASGGNDYDPVRMGLAARGGPGALDFDTRLRGNSNAGHWFTDDTARPGRIGPALSARDRAALIEYLKAATRETYPTQTVSYPTKRPDCPKDPDWAANWLKNLGLPVSN
ncbi:MAG: di-heme-cytochrome C peroxidase [Pseudomonadota bacterium]|nr:di-heme-cytochrome C peroxidase [Pseudomonadota bacterium]